MDKPNNSQSHNNYKPLTWIERLLANGADIKPGEGWNIILLMGSLFFLLLTAYLLKPVRDTLILVEGGAEARSYAVALQVIVLVILLPIYGVFSRQFSSRTFMICIAVFFSCNLLLFYILGQAGYKLSIPFFLWLGAFGVLMVSQFWAFTSQVYNKKSGERLFALVAVGASLGAWVGSAISRMLMDYFDSFHMLLISIIPLLVSAFLAANVKIYNTTGFNVAPTPTRQQPSLLSGFSLVIKSRYLLLIAIFVILMNWCSSIGEYLMAVLVETFYQQGIEMGNMVDSKESYIGKFYSEFYFWVNLIGLFIQFFIVSRLIKWAGFNIAFIVTPLLIFMGYGLLAFFPLVTLFKVIKISENGLNYSLQKTTLQILFLPTTRRQQYEARAVIDTVCWRIGDLLQAATVFIGLNLLNILPKKFLFLNLFLTLLMLILAFFIGKHYQRKYNSE
ncbi:Npt1/Npt2 family nucleotide transporter [Thalassotalea psychrophila]|uniref:ADP,ATP carrier protein n=1 Tax=Thalassotalea psychrophila TaxID=3065647 RepID=A0ABY9TWF5_9GAMM|nr:Npt1/Npt2 family nucleotide transporter [Colwelliaceae bacterium SQ149]